MLKSNLKKSNEIEIKTPNVYAIFSLSIIQYNILCLLYGEKIENYHKRDSFD